MHLEKRREYEEKKFKVMNLRQNVALRKRDGWGERIPGAPNGAPGMYTDMLGF